MSAEIMFRADFRPVAAETLSEHTGCVDLSLPAHVRFSLDAKPSLEHRLRCDCTCRVRHGRFEWTTLR